MILEYSGRERSFTCLFNFAAELERLDGETLFPAGARAEMKRIFDSSQAQWLGPGADGNGAEGESIPIELSGHGAVVYTWKREEES
jgi:hypothetical protein